MSITSLSGPVVAFPSPINNANPELGPSSFVQGTAILDPRPFYTYNPGQNFGSITAGWGATSRLTTINAIPMTLGAAIIAAAANTVNGTAMTLASTSVDGLAVGVSITRADTGIVVKNLLKLDPLVASVTANVPLGSNIMTVTAVNAAGGHCYNQLCLGMVLKDATNAGYLPTGTTVTGMASNGGGTGGGLLGTYTLSAAATTAISGDTITGLFTGAYSTIPYGNAGTIQLWHPGDMSSRAVSITCSSASGAGGVFTVNGLDVFGYAMTEQITSAPGSNVLSKGKKAFKYILSVTPNFTDGTYTYSVGTQDVVGFPVRSDAYQVGAEYDVSLMFNNAAIAASTGYLAAVLTPATATTGDVRGTYALQTASTGTLRLIATQSPLLSNLGSASGLYGVSQFTAF